MVSEQRTLAARTLQLPAANQNWSATVMPAVIDVGIASALIKNISGKPGQKKRDASRDVKAQQHARTGIVRKRVSTATTLLSQLLCYSLKASVCSQVLAGTGSPAH